ncbi:hypothetical protein M409DRAFT_25543 [Zasmidium cellare ATCC 36951]|uniref:Tautomerase cis-CaaD-like domain-containing protein n=1 Tax=Zasmidium cellare ATCC 36951 TaxID=1080233 RepID=A0A6A6CDB9_ZASCE|nr:uncharacterized protein M409DRAFT_25543 [Zasmidium cellare ATCC 36951]KAF2164200.1 hypothetical protein M409DRAFT_25543 [Zasmidium cellare ATCC 36951]
MPHWQIFHGPDAFQDDAHKQALARAITAHYARVMPAFYVVVNFIQVPHSSHFVGGEQASARGKPFARIAIAHIHINLPQDKNVYKSLTDKIDKLLKPHIDDKGYDWEYHIDETERLLWKINGQAPPEWKSEDEKVWMSKNYPVPPGEMAQARRSLSNL